MNHKALLVILDGWGKGINPSASAIHAAKTPYIDSLYTNYPNAELVTHGLEVGLPDGQMGNSEVGHLNIGAGRIVYQELARINKAIAESTLADNGTIKETIAYAIKNKKPVHLMGLVSDGGVHSHLNHIIAFSKIFTDEKITVYIHGFLDGRDTSPQGGKAYMKTLLNSIDASHAKLSTIVGRYYAMDRDNRWERISKAYNLLVKGEGELTDNPLGVIEDYYNKGISDEFMEAIKVGSADTGCIKEDDVVLFANFRTDRPRQLTSALTQQAYPEHNMSPLNLRYVTMTEYDSSYKNVSVVYTKDKLAGTIGEVLERNGLSQLRIAETEKYPHVTFFLSGGREKPFERENRIMVNSPKVATYDLQPEMSAYELTNKVHLNILKDQPDLIILNYANADMVGHTGDFQAAIQAAEVLDHCMESLMLVTQAHNYRTIIIADHGNSDYMINDDGSPNTAHTTNPVPIIVMDPLQQVKTVKDGKLADIAPTILSLMNVEKDKEMTGVNLAK